MPSKAMSRVVIDTNLIIAGRYRKSSAASKVIDMCISRRLIAVFSSRTKDENMNILEKVRPPADYLEKIRRFLSVSIYVPEPQTRVNICADASDNKYFETAIAGQAQCIITSDRHLLEHDGYYGIRVMRPADFLKSLEAVPQSDYNPHDSWIVD